MQVQLKKNVLSHFLVKTTKREALGDSEYRNKINKHHITQEKLTKSDTAIVKWFTYSLNGILKKGKNIHTW